MVMVKSDLGESVTAWGDRRHRRVGLLGGSFNPAHDGHLHAALAALTRLRLDEVWFLVSPQNPLKRVEGMAPFSDRLSAAQTLKGRHPSLFATGIEAGLGTRFTVDTVALLKKRFPCTRFVWLMGADNLFQISLWNRWVRLFHLVPVAIIDRPPYSRAVLASKAAKRFTSYYCPPRALMDRELPAWTFLHIRRHPASASEIRALTQTRSPQEPPIARKSQPSPQSETPAPVPPNTVDIVTASLEDDKGEDILVIDLRGRTSLADHMVIVTGRSARQVGAMAGHLVEKLKAVGVRTKAEGLSTCDWVLIDSGDIIVHLFRPEVRAFYNLEKMWVEDATIPTYEA